MLVTQIPWISAQADLSITLENGRIKRSEQNLGAVRKPVTEDHEPEVHGVGNGATSMVDNEVGIGKTDAKSSVLTADKDDIRMEMKASGASARLTCQFSSTIFFSPFVVFCLTHY